MGLSDAHWTRVSIMRQYIGATLGGTVGAAIGAVNRELIIPKPTEAGINTPASRPARGHTFYTNVAGVTAVTRRGSAARVTLIARG